MGKPRNTEGLKAVDPRLDNHKLWEVVFQYSVGPYEKGYILSIHNTYELAEKALNKNGYKSFLAIKPTH